MGRLALHSAALTLINGSQAMSRQTTLYKQLTLGQRYQIQALLEGYMQKEIANSVGVSPGALSLAPTRRTADSKLGEDHDVRLFGLPKNVVNDSPLKERASNTKQLLQ